MGDRERQNRAFIRKLVLLRDTEGQRETPGCGQIAVKICVLQTSRSDTGSWLTMCFRKHRGHLLSVYPPALFL
jgi:hypothetical protein